MSDPNQTAQDFLRQAAEEMADRAASRDSPEGERSMGRAVTAWWALYGPGIMARGHMTEAEGWQFMAILKKARGAQGAYREDDHTDDVAYAALAGEAAARSEAHPSQSKHWCEQVFVTGMTPQAVGNALLDRLQDGQRGDP